MASVTDAFGTTSYTLLANGMASKVALPRIGTEVARTIEVNEATRDAKTGIPTEVKRADGTVVRQTVNSRGEVIGVEGAGEIATLLQINDYTGNVTGMTTFASGELNSGTGVSTARHRPSVLSFSP